MTATVSLDSSMRALDRANVIRLARSRLRRAITAGARRASDVLLELPEEARGWEISYLLMAQPHWGVERTRKLLAQHRIGEMRLAGQLTERQRRVLAQHLELGR